MARAIDEEEVREHTPNNEADYDSTPSFSNWNKASEECTNWDERQAKDQSEMFHETHRLSSLERIYAETFLSLQEIFAVKIGCFGQCTWHRFPLCLHEDDRLQASGDGHFVRICYITQDNNGRLTRRIECPSSLSEVGSHFLLTRNETR